MSGVAIACRQRQQRNFSEETEGAGEETSSDSPAAGSSVLALVGTEGLHSDAETLSP